MSSRRLVQVVARQFSSTARRSKDEVDPGFAKLKVEQARFQKEDGLPVHLKGGGFDGILYRGTMGLGIVGVIFSYVLFYNLITGQQVRPKPWPARERRIVAQRGECVAQQRRGSNS